MFVKEARKSVHFVVPALLGALLLASCTSTTPSDGPSPSDNPSAAEKQTVLIGDIEVSAVSSLDVDRPDNGSNPVQLEGFVPALGESLADYAAQEVAWEECDDEYMCAEVYVPEDYDAPGTQAITLFLRKVEASQEPKIGTLFVNPGGPGEPGSDAATWFPTDGLEQYDIVGWDPRGTGWSTPIVCMDAAATDKYFELDFSPDDDTERAALLAGSKSFSDACWQGSGDYLKYISTEETARDLDLLRQLVGDEKLNYFGYSYGTSIAGWYLELFPTTVGKIVADSAAALIKKDEVLQVSGFEAALNRFAEWAPEEGWDLGSTKEEVLENIDSFFTELDAKPIIVEVELDEETGETEERELTQSLALTGFLYTLYSGEDGWVEADAALTEAMSGDGEYLLSLADLMNTRNGPEDYGAAAYAFPAISDVDQGNQGVLDADKRWDEEKTAAPILGKYWGPDYLNSVWAVPSLTELTITGAQSAPAFLVIGITGDPATPYAQSEAFAAHYTQSVLLTMDGEGHGAFGGYSTCIDEAVVAYLAEGKLPAAGTVCEVDLYEDEEEFELETEE
ncbi:MAG: alpha/beta hydrolase [Propionibacteriaceae bacterium]|jgi:pimeloyl-ACP methyl ester carboxylesterase|nr:alpha/beta hydrolase [Propionibacteriaceae bacterium]